jgi:hypothetical protein
VVTPGYATIGLAAPIIITVARLLQGFSVNRVGPCRVASETIAYFESFAPIVRAGSFTSLARSRRVRFPT